MVSSWSRRRVQEQARGDLERLVAHRSRLKGFRGSALEDLLAHALGELVDFTASRGGLVASAGAPLGFVLGTRALAASEAASSLLARPLVAELVRQAVEEADVKTAGEISIVPIDGRGERVLLLEHDEPPSEERRKVIRIFAENAHAAVANHNLDAALRAANQRLEARVAEQTRDLRAANLSLEVKTGELERTVRALQETETQLAQKERLAAMGLLAAGVAHEINNPCQALEVLGQGRSFDVVICDVMMPRVPGTVFYERAARSFPALRDRFVFLTAGVFTEEVRRDMGRLGVRLVNKPVELPVLEAVLAEVARAA